MPDRHLLPLHLEISLLTRLSQHRKTMATTMYPAQTYPIPQKSADQYFGPNGQPSPASSTSPASPRLTDMNHPYNPNPAKQLRPMKCPLYIPAVLRPTEHFPVMSPMTPPKSQRSSLQHIEDSANPELQQSDLDTYLSNWHPDDGDLNDVTGPPKQDHWKPDEASSSCDSPQCRSNFNLFKRKHHCRHCGHIFCSTHSNQIIPLDQEAQFHPDGQESRACDTCYKQFLKWDTARSMQRKNSDGSSSDSNSIVPSLGHRKLGSTAIAARGGPQRQPSVANSAPKDWSWSTF